MAIGKQPTHLNIAATGQSGPHHLIAQTGNAHAVLVGEGKHYCQRALLGSGGLKQQSFILKGKGRHGQRYTI